MSTLSETGHAVNVANFESLVSFVSGYGSGYNPTTVAITLPQLQALLSSAKDSLNTVSSIVPTYRNAVTRREAAFLPLSKLYTRIFSFLKSTDVDPLTLSNVRSIIFKLQGKRITPKKAQESTDPSLEPTNKEISSSQLSYTNRLENFNRLLQLLHTIPQYMPNEPELQLSTLTQLYTELSGLNSAVINATTQLSNARIERNRILYSPQSGVIDVALTCKTYARALFGTTSPQYRQISGLPFTKHRT
jgi:hypothetical protein